MTDHFKPSEIKSTRKQGRRIVDQCIFWEASKPHVPLDREHIFGGWLRQHVRAADNKHRLQSTIIGRPGSLTTRNINLRTGEPLLSKAKIVCKDCNSGWM